MHGEDRFRDGVTLHTSGRARVALRSVPWATTLPRGPQQSCLPSAGSGAVSGDHPSLGVGPQAYCLYHKPLHGQQQFSPCPQVCAPICRTDSLGWARGFQNLAMKPFLNSMLYRTPQSAEGVIYKFGWDIHGRREQKPHLLV